MSLTFLFSLFFFFFNDPATTEIYTLSLHDALPICPVVKVMQRMFEIVSRPDLIRRSAAPFNPVFKRQIRSVFDPVRSEEHTSELQSRLHLVCRLLLEKKK